MRVHIKKIRTIAVTVTAIGLSTYSKPVMTG